MIPELWGARGCDSHRIFLPESFQTEDSEEKLLANSQPQWGFPLNHTLGSCQVLLNSERVAMPWVSHSGSVSGTLYLLKPFIELLAVVQVKWSLVWVGWHLFYALVHSMEEWAHGRHYPKRFLKGTIISFISRFSNPCSKMPTRALPPPVLLHLHLVLGILSVSGGPDWLCHWSMTLLISGL